MNRALQEKVRRLERWNPPKMPIICLRDGDGYVVEGKAHE